MTLPRVKTLRCAIYTRKSSEEGLDQDFNSLHAQREACEAYIKSQQHEGWKLVKTHYDDGGYSGGTMNRPALTQLMQDIEAGFIDIIVVYKVDRLSRSLADFSKMVERFDDIGVSFVSITQHFNTSTSMGRLTLNVLLSFAQFEREVTGERIRDKIAASKKKGLWMGGPVPLGYDVIDRALVVNKTEARKVQHIYIRYRDLQSVKLLKEELDQRRLLNKPNRRSPQGQSFSRGGLYTLLKNPLYIGKIQHIDKSYEGQHQGIISTTLWEEVQEILSRNRHSQYLRSQAKEPSLLSGLLFDEHGHPFSPTHTRKKNRRYRYYVNQTKVQFKQSHPEALLRIPAQTLESVIESEIINLLSDEQQIVSAIDNFKFRASTQSALLEKASQLSERWVSMHTHQKIEFLGNILSRFILTRDSVKLIINPASLFKELLPESTFSLDNNISQSTEIIRRVSVNLKRCGVETKLIIQDGISREKQKPHADSVKAIQQSVKNALAWNQALLGGAIGSISELARKNQVSERYVNQIMKLAYLSPTIIESIIKENIPHDMTLGKLKKGIPFKWSEQEKMFLKP